MFLLLERPRAAAGRMAVAMNSMPMLTDFSMEKLDKEHTELPGRKQILLNNRYMIQK